jgi:hypothetical protein
MDEPQYVPEFNKTWTPLLNCQSHHIWFEAPQQYSEYIPQSTAQGKLTFLILHNKLKFYKKTSKFIRLNNNHQYSEPNAL